MCDCLILFFYFNLCSSYSYKSILHRPSVATCNYVTSSDSSSRSDNIKVGSCVIFRCQITQSTFSQLSVHVRQRALNSRDSTLVRFSIISSSAHYTSCRAYTIISHRIATGLNNQVGVGAYFTIHRFHGSAQGRKSARFR